jgi:hypothetical protein
MFLLHKIEVLHGKILHSVAGDVVAPGADNNNNNNNNNNVYLSSKQRCYKEHTYY